MQGSQRVVSLVPAPVHRVPPTKKPTWHCCEQLAQIRLVLVFPEHSMSRYWPVGAAPPVYEAVREVLLADVGARQLVVQSAHMPFTMDTPGRHMYFMYWLAIHWLPLEVHETH